MVSITSDTETVTINESLDASDYGPIVPRISRTATLDGGAVISTSGNSHADRTILIVATNVPPEKEDILRRIAIQALIVELACREGVFSGAISQFSAKFGTVTLTFLIQEKLTQD
jgi:hypothetical protein